MRILGIVAFCAALGGCASTTRGISETISIATTPSGAEAQVSGRSQSGFLNNGKEFYCTTPCSVEVRRSDDIAITLSKPGYEPQIVPLETKIVSNGAAGFAGNILLGGVVGMGVDAATGAAMDHKPNPVIVTLQPVGVPQPPPPPRRPAPRPRAPALHPAAGT
jgi:hypothetical protein